MANRINNPATQHFDRATQARLSGGKMFFYEQNSTTTLKDTFSDAASNRVNPNPVILDSNGFEPDIFGNGSYRIVLQNSSGVQQWERDPVSVDIDGPAFNAWSAIVDYPINGIVEYTNRNFYVSINTPNIANQPDVSPANWTQFDLLRRWNVNENYQVDDVVRSPNGIMFTAIVNNSAANPDSFAATSIWKQLDDIRITGHRIDVTVANEDLDLRPNGTGRILVNNGPLQRQTRQIFTSDGTWIKPAGCTQIKVESVGGGAAGGGAPANGTAGQGGGAGGYASAVLDVSNVIANGTVTIGSGGTGSTGQGGTGGNTNFQLGSFGVFGDGGLGGSSGNLSPALGNGGNGGSSSSDVIVVVGSFGGASYLTVTAVGANIGGYGGASFLSGSSKGGVQNSAGVTGLAYGGGGSGGCFGSAGGPYSGGDGADGVVIVTEYY